MDLALPNLLPPEPPPASLLLLAPLRPKLAALAARGIFLGTSSWKYPGWMGLVYSPDRHAFRGEFSETRFADRSLGEYAETFHAVGVDATYYTFPNEKFVAGLGAAVPETFRFGFKVKDEITAKRFPMLPRFAERRGEPNPNFLNADLFLERFLRPLETIRAKVGLVMFEFSRFHAPDFARGRDFLAALDRFLGALPKDWPFGVEVRNRNLLRPEFFAVLRAHGVAHLFNAWSGGPALDFQHSREGCWTAGYGGARLLIRPGDEYEASERRLRPYDRLREPFPQGRQAAVDLIREAMERGVRPMFVFFGNKYEGCAPLSMREVVEALDSADARG